MAFFDLLAALLQTDNQDLVVREDRLCVIEKGNVIKVISGIAATPENIDALRAAVAEVKKKKADVLRIRLEREDGTTAAFDPICSTLPPEEGQTLTFNAKHKIDRDYYKRHCYIETHLQRAEDIAGLPRGTLPGREYPCTRGGCELKQPYKRDHDLAKHIREVHKSQITEKEREGVPKCRLPKGTGPSGDAEVAPNPLPSHTDHSSDDTDVEVATDEGLDDAVSNATTPNTSASEADSEETAVDSSNNSEYNFAKEVESEDVVMDSEAEDGDDEDDEDDVEVMEVDSDGGVQEMGEDGEDDVDDWTMEVDDGEEQVSADEACRYYTFYGTRTTSDDDEAAEPEESDIESKYF